MNQKDSQKIGGNWFEDLAFVYRFHYMYWYSKLWHHTTRCFFFSRTLTYFNSIFFWTSPYKMTVNSHRVRDYRENFFVGSLFRISVLYYLESYFNADFSTSDSIVESLSSFRQMFRIEPYFELGKINMILFSCGKRISNFILA